jgi:hypothetical protein
LCRVDVAIVDEGEHRHGQDHAQAHEQGKHGGSSPFGGAAEPRGGGVELVAKPDGCHDNIQVAALGSRTLYDNVKKM